MPLKYLNYNNLALQEATVENRSNRTNLICCTLRDISELKVGGSFSSSRNLRDGCPLSLGAEVSLP